MINFRTRLINNPSVPFVAYYLEVFSGFTSGHPDQAEQT